MTVEPARASKNDAADADEISSASGADLAVAASADLKPALDEAAKAWLQKTGNHIALTYGPSGKLCSEIRTGGRFDLFISTSNADAARLTNAAYAGPPTTIASARLVLWASPVLRAYFPPENPILALQHKNPYRIALVNPRNSPFGDAAVKALKAARIFDELKLMIGDDTEQVVSWLQSGVANVAFLSAGDADRPGLGGGQVIAIPQSKYTPIRAAAVVLARSKQKQTARDFLKFVLSPEGQAIFGRYGFGPPPRSR